MGQPTTTTDQTHLTGSYAATLAVTEVGLGATLHAAHIPFTGHILSLNQIFLLAKASAHPVATRATPLHISLIAASLKSLAPIGKKITPMLAIFMQGLLFNLPLLLFGNNNAGKFVGAILASLWSFVQPLLIYYIIFGRDFFDALFLTITELTKKWMLPEKFFFIAIATGILVKALLACSAVLLAKKLPVDILNRILKKDKPVTVAKKRLTPVFGAFKDILMPGFVIASLITLTFQYVMEQNVETLFWIACRQLAIGFCFFWVLRKLPVEKIALLFQGNSFLGKAFSLAVSKVQNR